MQKIPLGGRPFLIPLLLALLVQLGTLGLDVMDVDAAQYASISQTLLKQVQLDQAPWNHFYDQGEDYLDKPPLIFWLTALSYSLFGISNFAFRLPSFLFGIWAVFSTWKFARKLYDQRTADLSALFLGTMQAVFLMNNDVKTDMFLLAGVIFAVWQLYEFEQAKSLKKWLHLIAGFIGVGIGMLAKGPLGMVIPAMALGAHYLVKMQWKSIFRWEWIPGLIVTGLVLLPMCIGLYEQFDLHPEKVVNGETGVSGLKFYFWTQSFGRITGESEWQNKTDPFFFVHTLLWAILPWTLVFIPAFWGKLKLRIQGLALRNKIDKSTKGSHDQSEWIALGGIILPFIALSMSRFKLPHYIFVTLPFVAIICGNWLNKKADQLPQWLSISNFVLTILLLLTSSLLMIWLFPEKNVAIWIGFVLFSGLSIVFFFQNEILQKVLLPVAFAIVAANFVLGLSSYSQLLNYQAGSQAGQYVQENEIPHNDLATFAASSHAFDFYSGGVVPNALDFTSLMKDYPNGPSVIYTSDIGLEFFQNDPRPHQVLAEFERAKVGSLNWKFLNPVTRKESLKKRYLVLVGGKLQSQ